MFWFMLQVDPIQSYLNLKIGLPPVLKAGSSGERIYFELKIFFSTENGKFTEALIPFFATSRCKFFKGIQKLICFVIEVVN
jgi:hypothetical protein